MSVSFSIADSSRGGRTFVLWVRGRLDAEAARTMVHRLAQAEHEPRTSVVLDMTGVTDVDPAGLRTLAEVTRSVREVGRVRVVAPPEEVVDLFRRAAIDEVVELVPPREPDDRRKRRVPVTVDRRTGADRRRPSTNGSLP
jgi:anti-anti-sigma factor